MKKTLNSKELSLLYYLQANKDINDISRLNLTTDDLEFIINNKLIREVVEDGTYVITKKGINAIENKHTISYSVGAPYEDLFTTLTDPAAIKIAYVMTETDFFAKVGSRSVKNIILKNLLKNEFFKLINDPVSQAIVKEIFFYNNQQIPYSMILTYTHIIEANIKELIKKKALELNDKTFPTFSILNGELLDIDDCNIESLISIYNTIKSLDSDGAILFN